jgi:hypothetical protein
MEEWIYVYIHVFLTSALVERKWLSSRPGRFIPGENAAGTHWIGGCVGPKTGLDDVKKRKFLTLPGLELQPFRRPARSQSNTDCADCAIPASNRGSKSF